MTKYLTRKFHWFLSGAIFIGLAAPIDFTWLAKISDLLIAIIVFIGFLTRPTGGQNNVSLGTFILNFIGCKFVLPLAYYYVVQIGSVDFAVGVMVLAALPAAAVSPVLAQLSGGDTEVSLKVLVIESVGTCLSVPLLFNLVSHQGLSVSPWVLGQYFSLVIVLPLIFAEIIRRSIGTEKSSNCREVGSRLSIICISVLLLGLTAKVRTVAFENLAVTGGLVVGCFFFAIFQGVIGASLSLNRQLPVRISLGMKNMYINIGLGLGVAVHYLSSHVVLMVIAYIIPINFLPKLLVKIIGLSGPKDGDLCDK